MDFDLASCGDTVKLWTVSESSIVPRNIFDPHPTSGINAISWNHTGKVLATAGQDGKIVLSLPNGNKLCALDTPQETHGECQLNTVGFGGNSRYLVTGGSSQLVYIWDLKKQTLAKSLKGHTGSVRCALFNKDSTVVASSSSDGNILLFSLLSATALPAATLTRETTQPIRSIQYSPFKRTQLASVQDDGTLALWDTSAMVLDTCFDNAHAGPATGVRFSPYNHLLMCTTGLDRTLKFFDVQDRTMVKEVDCGEPVTAVSFMDDGVTVAIGTTEGALKVYDLRAGFHPRKEVAGAHTGDVRCVAFQHRASAPTLGASGDGGGRVGGAGATAGGAHDSDSSSAAAVGVALGVRRGSAGDGSLDGGSGPRGGVSARNPLVRTALLNAAAVAASRATRPTTTTDQLEASLDREWPRTPTPPLDEDDIPSATSTPVRHPTSPPRNVQSARVSASPSPPHSASAHPLTSPAWNARPVETHRAESTAPSRGGGGSGDDTPGAVPPRQHPDEGCDGHTPARPAHGMQHDTASAQHNQLIDSAANSVRDVVEECLATFRRDIHRDVHNMHIDLIRQFQIQKNEMEHLVATMSLNDELVAEIERLRAENKQLRQQF